MGTVIGDGRVPGGCPRACRISSLEPTITSAEIEPHLNWHLPILVISRGPTVSSALRYAADCTDVVSVDTGSYPFMSVMNALVVRGLRDVTELSSPQRNLPMKS